MNPLRLGGTSEPGDARFTLLLVTTHTDRRTRARSKEMSMRRARIHQVAAHLGFIGYPVVGDPKCALLWRGKRTGVLP